MPDVSVVIPTYRRARYLTRAVKSVLSQEGASVEVVVVDDNGAGTPDQLATAKTLEGLPVVYVANEKNLGGSGARNAGIEAATSPFISFLDDDDVYLPGKIAVQLAKMREFGWDLSFMGADMRNADGSLAERKRFRLPEEPSREALLRAHMLSHLTPTATYMFRAEALRGIGGFDQAKTAQEFLLMLKAIERGLSIGYVDEVRVAQYMHEGERISTGEHKLAGEDALYAMKKLRFPSLSFADRAEIRARHHATRFFVLHKRGERASALREGALAVCCSPMAAMRLLWAKRGMR